VTISAFSKEYEQLREMLIRARKESGLTQFQVAQRLGKPQSFVSKYERGERRLDVIEFVEVVRALNREAGDFLAEFSLRGSAR
jgi:transcriptional regulator with XRE-family HTH domain